MACPPDASGWEAAAIASLRELRLDDTPSLEFLLLDELVRWVVSDSNPGREYGEQHAAIAVSALLNATEAARSFRYEAEPQVTEDMAAARAQVVAGAHDLAETADGLTLLITRLMPAAASELMRNAGDHGAQVYWLYYYCLLALTGGSRGHADESVLRGLIAGFDAWDALFAAGRATNSSREDAQASAPIDSSPEEPMVPGNSSDLSVGRIDAAGAQGVQVGDHSVQQNTFIGQYVETQIFRTTSAPVSPVRVGDVPQQPPAFQARRGLLATLALQGPTVPLVQTIIGMRGTGKTQLAAAYARRRMAEGWRVVAWVNAGDMNKVLNGLSDVSVRLGLNDPSRDLESAALAVRNWLEADGAQCMLVFDNAVDLNGIRPYVPAAGHAQVIITTTLQAASNLGLPVNVHVFTEDEALAFLAERTGIPDIAGAQQLAAELGYLPLALAQAAAVIVNQRLSYATYLDRLRTLPVSEYLVRVEADPYPRRFAAAVLLSMDSAGARDSSALPGSTLDAVADLSSTGIHRALLYVAGQQGILGPDIDPYGVQAAVDAALAQLAEASLLTFSADGTTVRAHRLVMRVVRELRAQEGTLAATGLAVAKLLSVVANALPQAWQNPEPVRDVIQQITALHEHLAPLLTDADTELVATLLVLRGRALSLWLELGDSPTQGIEFAQSLVADYERLLPGHRDTLLAQSNLAVAYQAAGRVDEAVLVSEHALADYQHLLGDDAAGTATLRNNLAHAYQAAGRIDEAIELYKRALADRERIADVDHPGIWLVRNNLAHAYQRAERIAEAIPLFERTLAEREQFLEIDHPHIMLSRANLGASYQAAGRVDEAIPLFERTLADQERLHRGEHPDTLALRNNLAHAYQAVGRIAEAIPLYERTLADCERILGTDHPNTQIVREDLARTQLTRGGRAPNSLE